MPGEVDGWWRTHRKAQRLIAKALDDGLDLFYGQCRQGEPRWRAVRDPAA